MSVEKTISDFLAKKFYFLYYTYTNIFFILQGMVLLLDWVFLKGSLMNMIEALSLSVFLKYKPGMHGRTLWKIRKICFADILHIFNKVVKGKISNIQKNEAKHIYERPCTSSSTMMIAGNRKYSKVPSTSMYMCLKRLRVLVRIWKW